MSINPERIAIHCINFYSALSEKNLSIEHLFPTICHIAKLTNLAESLRTDVDQEIDISFDIAKIFCQKFKFYDVEQSILEKLANLNILKIGEKKVEVICKSQKKILQIMGEYWLEKTNTNKESILTERALIELLETLSTKPLTKQEIKNILLELSNENCNSLLIILKNLNLLIYLDELDIYCSPETFGTNSKKDIVAQLSEFRTADKLSSLINILTEVKENPAMPFEHILNKDLAKELSLTGLLEPYGINVNGQNKKFLFSPELKNDDLYLIKETAAHFRFANTYANSTYGKLNDPSLFLTKLLERGVSGSATNIGTDYNSLILNRIVRIEKGGLSERYKMYPVKKDILEGASDILEGIKPFQPKSIDTTLADFTKNPPQTRLDAELQKAIGVNWNTTVQEALRLIKSE